MTGTGDATTDGILVVAFGLLLILALVVTAAILRLLEHHVPPVTRFLDKHWEEPEWQDRHRW